MRCKTCLNREYKDRLFCCAVAELNHSFHNLVKTLPLFGKYVKKHECGFYMEDKRMTGFPEDAPIMCRCSIVYEVNEDGKDE